MTALSPVADEPALLLESDGVLTLVLADLHIGLEWELGESGIHIPSGTEDVTSALLGCLEDSGAEKVLIIGDLKHNVPVTSGQEFREIPEFISQISNRSRVDIIPGNHDGGIENLLKKKKNVTVHATGGVVAGGVGFFHGHSWPGESLLMCDTMVCAHNHPTVRLEDEVGHVRTERVWLRAPVDPGLLEKKYPGVKDFVRGRELASPRAS